MNHLFTLCSVCFTDPKSPMSHGAVMGILFLLGVVAFVLGGIAATAIVWARRAKKIEFPSA